MNIYEMPAVFTSMPISGLALVTCIAIYFTSAILAGLSGFGFSAFGAISICFLPPEFAVSMLMSVSLVTQIYSFRAMLSATTRLATQQLEPVLLIKKMVPYTIGGIGGLYVGIGLLTVFSAEVICVILGAFLSIYAAYCLMKPIGLQSTLGSSPRWSGVIGFLSTMIGAFCGGPGIVLMAWFQLCAVPKDVARRMVQPFIIFMQSIGLTMFILKSPSVFSASFFVSIAILLPIALLGSEVGVRIYTKTSEFNYRKIVTFLLLGSGITLILKAAMD